MRTLCGTILAVVASAVFGAVEKAQAVTIHSATTNGVEVRWFEEMVPMKDFWGETPMTVAVFDENQCNYTR